MKKILVTGGAGFIGSHLCERLLQEGHYVLCVDNYLTGKKENIEHLLDNPYFEFQKHDINFPLYVEVDEIYNLACPGSPYHYRRDPVNTIITSIKGSNNMLETAKAAGASILQASTSEVYGDPEKHPQPEEYRGNVNHLCLRGCYSEGKRCAETLFFNHKQQYNTEVKIARIFNTYGPRIMLDDGRVVSNFIVQALQNKNLTIYGDGLQTRSFCYINDLIEALIRLMEMPPDFSGPVNLGNPEEITILSLAETIINLTGSNSKLVFKPERPFDPRRRKPDISRARKELNWSPRVSLKTGLSKTISYIEKELISVEKY